jgi:hypothetical protein
MFGHGDVVELGGVLRQDGLPVLLAEHGEEALGRGAALPIPRRPG